MKMRHNVECHAWRALSEEWSIHDLGQDASFPGAAGVIANAVCGRRSLTLDREGAEILGDTYAQIARCESFVELLLGLELVRWGAYCHTSLGFGLLTQHKVDLNGRRVRLDFALTGCQGSRVAIEVDGHNFHERTKEQAALDRSRDRGLTLAGWSVLRFTGSEVWHDPESCAMQVLRLEGEMEQEAMRRKCERLRHPWPLEIGQP